MFSSQRVKLGAGYHASVLLSPSDCSNELCITIINLILFFILFIYFALIRDQAGGRILELWKLSNGESSFTNGNCTEPETPNFVGFFTAMLELMCFLFPKTRTISLPEIH